MPTSPPRVRAANTPTCPLETLPTPPMYCRATPTLFLHAHALLARLLPAALVEQQPLIARLARKAVLCASGHVHHHALRVPVRLADEVLKLLIVTAGDAFLHTLYITFTLVEKTFQILLAARCAVLAPASEVIPVGTGVDVNFFSSKFGKAITIK